MRPVSAGDRWPEFREPEPEQGQGRRRAQRPGPGQGSGQAPPGLPDELSSVGGSPFALGAPYCAACGYDLVGVIDSPVCPECGRPLVDVLLRRGGTGEGAEPFIRRCETTIAGLPLYMIAYGRDASGSRVVARGLFAMGETAVGVVAIGNVAVGGVAIGGAAFGLASAGGLSVGLLSALGGAAVGGLASGGVAVGVLASGGGAFGVIAEGGGAMGWVARGGGAIGRYVIDGRSSDPFAQQVFDALWWFFGSGASMLFPVLWTTGLPTLLLIVAGLLGLTIAGPAVVREALTALRESRHRARRSATAARRHRVGG